MKPVAYVLSAALLALTVAACDGSGAKSAGPVPTVPSAAEGVGFLGLPPKGAEPSTPRRGKLVAFWWASIPGDWGKSRFWVFADGRLISLREAGAYRRSTGFLEQRVTPEGVQRLRSATGGSDPQRLLGDVTSELPKRAWVDRTIRAYVPSRYAVCVDADTRELERLWSLLPGRAKDVLHGNKMDPARSREPIEYCWDLTTKEARALSVALDDANFERDPGAKAYGLSYLSKWSDPMAPDRGQAPISFEPILPNREWTCSPCG